MVRGRDTVSTNLASSFQTYVVAGEGKWRVGSQTFHQDTPKVNVKTTSIIIAYETYGPVPSYTLSSAQGNVCTDL